MKKEIAPAAAYLVQFLPILFRLRPFLPNLQAHITDYVSALIGAPGLKQTKKHRFYEYIPSPNKLRAIEHFNELNQLWEEHLAHLYNSNDELKSSLDSYIAAPNDAGKEAAFRAVIESILETNDTVVSEIAKRFRYLQSAKPSTRGGTNPGGSRGMKGKGESESAQRTVDEERPFMTETGVKIEEDPSASVSDDFIGGFKAGGLSRGDW